MTECKSTIDTVTGLKRCQDCFFDVVPLGTLCPRELEIQDARQLIISQSISRGMTHYYIMRDTPYGPSGYTVRDQDHRSFYTSSSLSSVLEFETEMKRRGIDEASPRQSLFSAIARLFKRRDGAAAQTKEIKQ